MRKTLYLIIRPHPDHPEDTVCVLSASDYQGYITDSTVLCASDIQLKRVPDTEVYEHCNLRLKKLDLYCVVQPVASVALHSVVRHFEEIGWNTSPLETLWAGETGSLGVKFS